MRMAALYRRQTDTCSPIFKFSQAERATRQRRPLLQLKAQRLMLPARRWKRLFQLCIAEGMRMRALHPRQTDTCSPIFKFSQAERATRQRRPLLKLKTRGLMLPARCWKRSLQHRKCTGDANGSGLPTANKYLFANLLLFASGEGDETTSSSFTAAKSGIDASSTLLEALIATRYMQRACDGSTLLTANRIPVCRSLIVSKRRGRQGNVALS